MVKICKILICGLVLCAMLGGCGDSGDSEVTIIGRGGDGQAAVGGTAGTALSNSDQTLDTGAGYDAGPAYDGSAAQPDKKEIRVYVCGAVVSPGVVSLPEDSRAEDALAAAGGFAENAWREYVNLAERVQDGEKLYFPTLEETGSLSLPESDSGLVNINTADAAALCTLPGIGESRANDIIAYREANGPFESCEDIMNVTGIKTSVYNKIMDKITVR